MRTTTTALSSSTFLLLSACAYDPESGTDEDVLARIAALEEARDTLEDENETQAAQLEELQTENDTLKTQFEDLERQVTELESNGITLLTESKSVTVSDAAELEAALDELDRYRLARDVTYTIVLEDGEYELSEPLTVDHPDGVRVYLVGDTSNPAAVTLSFPSSSGVVIPKARALGGIEGFTLTGADAADSVGVDVQAGGYLAWGSLRISGFYRAGVRVRLNGTLIPLDGACDAGQYIEVTGGDYGFEVSDAGVASLCNAVVYSAGVHGFYSTALSFADAEHGTSSGHANTGFRATAVSYLGARGSEAAGGQAGYSVADNGFLRADGADGPSQASETSSYCLQATHGGVLYADDVDCDEVGVGAGATHGGLVYADGATFMIMNDSSYAHFASLFGLLSLTNGSSSGYWEHAFEPNTHGAIDARPHTIDTDVDEAVSTVVSDAYGYLWH